MSRSDLWCVSESASAFTAIGHVAKIYSKVFSKALNQKLFVLKRFFFSFPGCQNLCFESMLLNDVRPKWIARIGAVGARSFSLPDIKQGIVSGTVVSVGVERHFV